MLHGQRTLLNPNFTVCVSELTSFPLILPRTQAVWVAAFIIIIIIMCVWVFNLHLYLCTTFTSDACGALKQQVLDLWTCSY